MCPMIQPKSKNKEQKKLLFLKFDQKFKCNLKWHKKTQQRKDRNQGQFKKL